MFKKSLSHRRDLNPDTAESLADILFEIGKDLLIKKQYQQAAKWLDRALDIFNGQELNKLSIDASELRISVIQSLVKSLVALENSEAYARARNLVDLLEDEVGDRLIVLLLRLELVSADSNEIFNSTLYSDVLRRMTRSMVLSDANMKLVLFHVRKLNDKSPSLACKTLDDLLRLRLFHAERTDWLERALVTRLYMTVHQRDCVEVLATLEDILNDTNSNLNDQISSTAALAAHAVSQTTLHILLLG